MQSAVEEFDAAVAGLAQLVAVAEHGVDRETLVLQLVSGQQFDREWAIRRLGEPLGRLERFHRAQQQIKDLLARERKALGEHEAGLAQLRQRHSRMVAGEPGEEFLRAQVLRAVATLEELRTGLNALTLRTGRKFSDAFFEQVREGLALCLETAVKIWGEWIREQVHNSIQVAMGEVRVVLNTLSSYEHLLKQAERETGRPLRVPRLALANRGAWESVAGSGGHIEWTAPGRPSADETTREAERR